MAQSKKIRQKGKLKLSQYFKKIDENASVTIVHDPSLNLGFPKRFIGKSGKVIGTRGFCKLVQLMDGKKEKIFIVHPLHLRVL